jgi:hypothetical protein
VRCRHRPVRTATDGQFDLMTRVAGSGKEIGHRLRVIV